MSSGNLGNLKGQEREYEQLWISDNQRSFSTLARHGLLTVGRGAILVNVAELILRKRGDEGHPFNYHVPSDSWSEADEIADIDTRKRAANLLADYSLDREVVLLIVKYQRLGVHRVPLQPQKEPNIGIPSTALDIDTEEQVGRLSCSDFWARSYLLTTVHMAEW